MILGYWILKEGQFLNTGIAIGIALSFTALILFVHHGYLKKGEDKNKKTPLAFILYVLTYSVIWGFAVFSFRYFGINGVERLTFLSSWYGGSLLTALVIFLTYTDKDETQKIKTPLTLKDVGWVGILSVVIFLSLFLAYWSYQLAPIIVLQTIYLVAEMVLPSIIGLVVFHERKKMDAQEWIYFGIGITGGVLVALNF